MSGPCDCEECYGGCLIMVIGPYRVCQLCRAGTHVKEKETRR